MRSPSSTYQAFEDGHQRQPIELYTITMGASVWRHCAGDEAITLGGNVYQPATIERTGLTFDDKSEATTLTVTFARVVEPVASSLAYAPPDPVTIRVSHLIRDQSPYEECVVFEGIMRSASLKGVAVRVECVGTLDRVLRRMVPS